MRDSVVFYRSFYEAVKNMPPEDFKKSVSAIMDYGLDDIEPNTSGIEKTIYLLTKPQIDANNRRYLNGTKGGRKKGEPKLNQDKTKEEPKPNQTETKPEPKEKEKEKVKEKVNVKDNKNTSAPADSDESPCAGKFLLNDGSEYRVTENDVVTYQQLYPGIDVRQEIRSIEAWCLSNPKNRKTRNGAKRFLNGWLSRTQNRARPEKPETAKNNKFNNFPQRNYNYDDLEKQLLNARG